MIGSGMKSGREFQTMGPATEKRTTAVSLETVALNTYGCYVCLYVLKV